MFVTDALQCTESSEGVRRLMDKMVESRIQSLGLRRCSQRTGHGDWPTASPTFFCSKESKCEMLARATGFGGRRARPSNGQGPRKREAGERSPVAGQDNREKLGQKGRFPLVVIFSCPCNNFMLNSNGLNIKFPLQLINFQYAHIAINYYRTNKPKTV